MKFTEFLIGIGVVALLIVLVALYSKWEAKRATSTKKKFKYNNK